MTHQVVELNGVQVRVDAFGRYCLNDLHRAAVAAGSANENHAPGQFLRSDKVQEFVAAVDAEKTGDVQKRTSVHTVKGGLKQGTYADELVALRYAAWIGAKFEVHVYRTFLRSTKEQGDWQKLRHAAASSTKVQASMLQQVRNAVGKATAPHHYMNEHKLVNSLLSGEYKGLDRESLTTYQLDLLAHLELRNAVLIGMGMVYAERKGALKVAALDFSAQRRGIAANETPTLIAA
jgi:hypothetical protein